jgi:hypothetical protein
MKKNMNTLYVCMPTGQFWRPPSRVKGAELSNSLLTSVWCDCECVFCFTFNFPHVFKKSNFAQGQPYFHRCCKYDVERDGY